ncbi:MAG TPA: sugar phosphate nucleotidyltransferase [Patescibacteria group bacterium]|nr:sugar phosphate nucleotidyltransferase [Patescibacteria group bacterium]
MQALLLAAGKSSRFFPFNAKHKCAISLLGDPIIVHTVRAVKRAGINDIVIVVSPHSDFQEILGNGKKYGVKINYVVQKEATGMGDAILSAASSLTSDFFLLNSYHVDFPELKEELDKKRGTNKNVVLLTKEQEDVSSYGVISFEGDNVTGLVEKPKKGMEPSKLVVKGVYFLPLDFIRELKKTKKHHDNLEIAIDKYAKEGKVKFVKTQRALVTLKYPWDLLTFKDFLLSKVTKSISKKASVSKDALITGNVVIEEGAVVSERATIKGPAYIGKNAYIGSNTLIRNGTVLEERGVIGGFIEVKNTIIFEGAKTHSGVLEDSIIGKNSRLGAGFTSANVRLDRKNITPNIFGEKIDSGFRDLGVIMGDSVMLGARVTTMPGVIIGNNVNIGPSTTVMENLDSDITFYTEFKKVIKKAKSAPIKK